ERLFNRPALSVGAIEDGDVTSIVSRFALQSGDFLDDEARLVVLVKALADDDLGAFGSGGAQGALDALGILANDRVCRREDLGRRAIVLFQVHLLRLRVVVLVIQDVANVGGAPAVDRLVGIADDAQVAMLLAALLHEQILQVVGVLVLVDQHVLVALLEAPPGVIGLAHQA